MEGRRPFDLFEPWPDVDDELPTATGRTVAVMVALVAVVMTVLVIAMVVALFALGHYLDDRANDPSPQEGLRALVVQPR